MNQKSDKNWIILYNPVSGAGKSEQLAVYFQGVFGALKIECETYESKFKQDFINHFSTITQGFCNCLVIGGDGTFHDIVNGFWKSSNKNDKLVFAFYPSGTGNDFIRNFSVPKNKKQFILELISNAKSIIDIGKVELNSSTQMFINIAGIGMDSYVAERYLKDKKKKSSLTYILGSLLGIFFYKNQSTTWTLDQLEPNTQKSLLITVGNGTYFGKGMKILPEAKIQDGLLDILIAGDINILNRIHLFLRVFSGKFLPHKNIQYVTGKKIKIESMVPLAIQADGELIGYTPSTISIVPNAINILNSMKQ